MTVNVADGLGRHFVRGRHESQVHWLGPPYAMKEKKFNYRTSPSPVFAMRETENIEKTVATNFRASNRMARAVVAFDVN